MLRKDYIQRQFEEFGKALALLLNLKLNKNWEVFEKEMAEAFKKFTSFELDKIEGLSEEAFNHEITGTPTLLYDQKKILANLLFEKMNVYQERNETEKYLATKTKCQIIYQNLSEDLTQNEYDLEVHYRVEFLRNLNTE
ncbi:hypothetical protein [Aurantibacillus circumpalustris]|uniref:hypothetical protein n=1 Tax=Aurantibacillus circumpalustris TaxID=3036359 RepID=UPI00295AF89C|nr:hypothetical protein [Aurantibacillus circumpalustris]